jgi:hypothetical protein
MTKKAFEKIKAGLEEAVAIVRGEKQPAKITVVEVKKPGS